MSSLSPHIAKRLRAIRKTTGKSARAFAKEHCIPESTYSQHETGKRSLTIEILMHYSHLLNVHPGWLVTGKGEPYLSSTKNKKMTLTLDQELKKLGKIIAFPNNQQYAALDQLAKINTDLFTDILHSIGSHSSKKGVKLDYENLLKFCMSTYKNIINSVDKQKKSEIIQLNLSSIKTWPSSS